MHNLIGSAVNMTLIGKPADLCSKPTKILLIVLCNILLQMYVSK